MGEPTPNAYDDNPHPAGTMFAAFWDIETAMRSLAAHMAETLPVVSEAGREWIDANKREPMGEPTTDKLAEVLKGAWWSAASTGWATVDDYLAQSADAIRAALADGSLSPADLGMEPAYEVNEDGREYYTGTWRDPS